MNPLRLQFLESCLRRGSSLPHITTASLFSTQIKTSSDEIEGTQRLNPGSRKLQFLDVGCGGGILAESLARLNCTRNVLGIDPTQGVLDVAVEHARRDPALKGRLKYLNTTVDKLSDIIAQEKGTEDSQEELFDVVTAMEVVEHVPDPQLFLQHCMDHVKPGGWVVGSTIARTWTSYVTTKLVAEDILNIVPRGTHDWNKYMNASELESFFKTQNGWGGHNKDNIVFMGCIYLPFLGWKVAPGGEKVGNYFFGIRRDPEE